MYTVLYTVFISEFYIPVLHGSNPACDKWSLRFTPHTVDCDKWSLLFRPVQLTVTSGPIPVDHVGLDGAVPAAHNARRRPAAVSSSTVSGLSSGLSVDSVSRRCSQCNPRRSLP
eukprot:COSAG02_NODE_922_length_15907_cov_4.423303_3_plen_114_part_00